MALADQPRVIGLTLAESWRRFAKWVRSGSRSPFSLTGPSPERVYLAPQDLRTADPTVAQEIYAGRFTLGGKQIEAGSNNPFAITDADPHWLRAVHGFRWIRHMGADQNTLSRRQAQILVKDWITSNAKQTSPQVWETEVAASRLIAWLHHSVIIVEDGDLAFYRLFLKSIGRHIRFLRNRIVDAEDGLPVLLATIALAYASICVSDQNFVLRNAKRNLDEELDRQIMNDGGHVSRNPAALVEILAYLLPLRQSYAKIEQSPSPTLVTSIDRMMTALRFFRHRDGSIAHFNSAVVTEPDLIAVILRYDETMGKPSSSFTTSGYERLDGGDTTIIMDTGLPPRGTLSALAGAGTLAFEMSCAGASFIVNCGIPPFPSEPQIAASRSTAAHSTVTLNDASSSRFETSGAMARFLHRQIISGPSKVPVSRSETGTETVVTASHDGYVRPVGVVHERAISLSADGRKFYGSDRFTTPDGKDPIHVTRDDAALRFHLHPGVHTGELESLNAGAWAITLAHQTGVEWRFVSLDGEISVEDGVFFANLRGGMPTRQLVIRSRISETHELRWALERMDQPVS